jgi:hypothetical protein
MIAAAGRAVREGKAGSTIVARFAKLRPTTLLRDERVGICLHSSVNPRG